MTPDTKFFDLGLLRRVLQYARPYKKKFYFSIVMAIVLAVFTIVRPALIEYTIDNYIINHMARAVIIITIIQVGFIFLETALRFYFSFTTSWLGQAVVKDLRVKVYEKVLRLNLRQFDKTPIGTLTTRTVDDIERINDIFADGLIPIIADLLSIVAVISYMVWRDWELTLICLIPFPILLIATYFFKESVNRSFHTVRNAVTQLNGFVQEHLSGMSIVQVFGAEKKEYEKFRQINKQHRDANIKAIFAYSVFFPIVEIVLALSIGLVVWWTSKETLAGEPGDISGKIVSFILCLNLLFRPLRIIADKFNVLQMGIIASDRVFRVMDNNDIIDREGNFNPEVVKGKIDFENVSFGYNKDQDVLRHLTFSVIPGQTVAIVGHTGSGKTTIISLLNRLYEIDRGQIRIDNVPVDEWKVDALRKNIGVVLQDVYLFSGSIMDNLTLRNPEIPEEKVIEAAKLIGMHDFIMNLPGGYDYNVMERGATLSVGQRQLLSFIRALLYNPSILILDEATSSIDTESELLIEHAIETLVSGRTSIVIAHRLSTIQRADQIIVLDKGEIRETGTHSELLSKNGYYSRLYHQQIERKELIS